MSTESELLVLKGEGLPTDDLSMENAVIIQQSIPVTFVIDSFIDTSKSMAKESSQEIGSYYARRSEI